MDPSDTPINRQIMKVFAILLCAGLLQVGSTSPRMARGLMDFFSGSKTQVEAPPPVPVQPPTKPEEGGLFSGIANLGSSAAGWLKPGSGSAQASTSGQASESSSSLGLGGKLTGMVSSVGGFLKPSGTLGASLGAAAGMANMANNIAGIVNTATGLASNMASKGTALGTNIGQMAVQGAGDMIHTGLTGGSEITHNALGIADSVGSIVRPAKPIITVVTTGTGHVMDGAFQAGHHAVDMATGLATNILQTTNKTVQGATSVVSGITTGLGTAQKGMGKVTGMLGSWLS